MAAFPLHDIVVVVGVDVVLVVVVVVVVVVGLLSALRGWSC